MIITIKCASCKRKVFKYSKIGKGRVLYCGNARIVRDYGIREGDEVECQRGNLIGVDEGKWTEMKQH